MNHTATFGAGCFWGVEQRFRELDGVVDAVVGYMGGHVDHPTYEQVCTDRTGHAEVCRVTFDPERVAYADLVREFFALHDPTQVDRQGADVGRQYRSVIFYADAGQQQVAGEVKAELAASGRYSRPIATSIEPESTFWQAEDYHQQYLARSGASCSLVTD